MGWGDFDIGAQNNPALTTLHLDFRALGKTMGPLLWEPLADDAAQTPRLMEVGLTVVERTSAGGSPCLL
jgi:LacI family gluconate utilization system Gnt-I transcriptional repressor